MRTSAFAGLLQRGAWGLADQALLSVATFFTLALLARSNGPHDFGILSLALAFMGIELAIAASFLSEPFAVISASFDRKAYRGYVTSIYLAQVGLGLIVSFLVVLFALLLALADQSSLGLVLLVAPAMLAVQLQDFTRQPLYVEGRMPAAFLNDLVSYGGQMLALGIALQLDVLSNELALAIMAVSSTLAILVGLIQLRSSISLSLPRSTFASHLLQTWRFGRWTLGTTLLATISNHLYPFFLAAFSGAAAAGQMRAMLTLLGPARIIVRGIGTAFTPIAAITWQSNGTEGLRRLVRQMLVLGTPPMAAYCLLVSAKPKALVELLFGESYTVDADWLLPAVALSYLILFIYLPIETALRARRVTNVLFRAGLLNFFAFWLLGVPLIYFLGLAGAAVTLVLVPSVFGIAIWQAYRREMSG